MKKFAVFDIDGTLFRWQLFHEIVLELIESNYVPKENRALIDKKVSEWRSRKHPHSWHDYEIAIVDAFKACLNNLPVNMLERAADAVLQRSGNHVYTYTRNLIGTLRQEGYTLIAISGSQDEVVQRFAKLWQFDIALGQVHDSKDGIYTGTIPGGTLLVLQKGELLKKIVKEHTLSWKDSIAVGDSRSDAAMLKLVEQPIAFNPNDQLFEIAKKEGWKVVVERKNMIYESEPHNGTYLLARAST